MLDDETGEPLMQRPDDTAEALPKRLEAFHKETTAVLNHYEPLNIVQKVDANRGMDVIKGDVLALL